MRSIREGTRARVSQLGIESRKPIEFNKEYRRRAINVRLLLAVAVVAGLAVGLLVKWMS